MSKQSELGRWAELGETYRGASNWLKFYERLLENVDFKGKSVLDIGGGIGLASTYALLNGAEMAVLLEPEEAGSRRDVLVRAEKLRSALGLQDKLQIEPLTFQAFDAPRYSFDVVILEASINHLDEDAVEKLHQGGEALKRYQAIVGKLADMLRPGAVVVISDCARRNFFGDLGLRNPLAPTINWEKHQQPATWKKLFIPYGFSKAKVGWGIHSTLGPVGKAFLDNKIAFYFLSSYFILTMHYQPIRKDA